MERGVPYPGHTGVIMRRRDFSLKVKARADALGSIYVRALRSRLHLWCVARLLTVCQCYGSNGYQLSQWWVEPPNKSQQRHLSAVWLDPKRRYAEVCLVFFYKVLQISLVNKNRVARFFYRGRFATRRCLVAVVGTLTLY